MDPGIAALRRNVLACVAAGAASGCTTVSIDAGDGAVRVERGWGVSRVEVPASDAAVVGAVRGAGAGVAPLGRHPGHTQQRWALRGPQCRAVLWLDGSGIDDASRRWITGVRQVCAVLPTRTTLAQPAAAAGGPVDVDGTP